MHRNQTHDDVENRTQRRAASDHTSSLIILNSSFRLWVLAGLVLSTAGCMTPGYQYIDPPGFSSTYFQIRNSGTPAVNRMLLARARERYETASLPSTVELPLRPVPTPDPTGPMRMPMTEPSPNTAAAPR